MTNRHAIIEAIEALRLGACSDEDAYFNKGLDAAIAAVRGLRDDSPTSARAAAEAMREACAALAAGGISHTQGSGVRSVTFVNCYPTVAAAIRALPLPAEDAVDHAIDPPEPPAEAP